MEQLNQISAVATFHQRLSQSFKLDIVNPSLPPSHLFWAAHFEALAMLEGAEARIEIGRINHLLNHWLLFGREYAAATMRAVAMLMS